MKKSDFLTSVVGNTVCCCENKYNSGGCMDVDNEDSYSVGTSYINDYACSDDNPYNCLQEVPCTEPVSYVEDVVSDAWYEKLRRGDVKEGEEPLKIAKRFNSSCEKMCALARSDYTDMNLIPACKTTWRCTYDSRDASVKVPDPIIDPETGSISVVTPEGDTITRGVGPDIDQLVAASKASIALWEAPQGGSYGVWNRLFKIAATTAGEIAVAVSRIPDKYAIAWYQYDHYVSPNSLRDNVFFLKRPDTYWKHKFNLEDS